MKFVHILDDTQFERLIADTYIDKSVQKRWQDMVKRDEMVIFAAELDGKYIGRVNLWLAPADEPEVRNNFPGVPLVDALQVLPEHKSKGVGTALMRALEAEAIKRGFDKVGLGVEPDNLPAVNLYKKLRYKHKKVGGKKAFKSSWDETGEDGSIKKVTVNTQFMLKILNLS